jgi:glycosyltransferase involved in cell wall biosynthesis
MKIGIITASYNRPDLLRRCIDSVRSQSYSNWVMYVVDDCSIVNIDELSDMYRDPRLSLQKLPQNVGANHVRNVALARALHDGCDAIFLLDDDDFLTEHALQNMVDQTQAYPNESWFVFNIEGYQRVLEPYTFIQQPFSFDYISDYLLGKKVRSDKSHLIRADAVRHIRFSTQVRNGDEWTFFLQIAKRHQCMALPNIVKVVDYQNDGLSVALSGRQYTFQKICLDMKKPVLCWYYRPLLRRAATRSLQSVFRFPVRLLLLAWQQCQYLLASRQR